MGTSSRFSTNRDAIVSVGGEWYEWLRRVEKQERLGAYIMLEGV